jgi:hypothetical protein
MRLDPTRTAYAAAKQFGITQAAINQRLPDDLRTARMVRCPSCGHAFNRPNGGHKHSEAAPIFARQTKDRE